MCDGFTARGRHGLEEFLKIGRSGCPTCQLISPWILFSRLMSFWVLFAWSFIKLALLTIGTDLRRGLSSVTRATYPPCKKFGVNLSVHCDTGCLFVEVDGDKFSRCNVAICDVFLQLQASVHHLLRRICAISMS